MSANFFVNDERRLSLGSIFILIYLQQDPILNLEIVLPTSQVKLINLYPFDTPLQMAYRFSIENGIQIKQVKALSESIINIISSAIQDERLDCKQNFYSNYLKESIKNALHTSFSKFTINNCNKQFKLRWLLTELINIETDVVRDNKQSFVKDTSLVRIKTEGDSTLLSPIHYQSSYLQQLSTSSKQQIKNDSTYASENMTQKINQYQNSSQYSENSFSIYERGLQKLQEIQEKHIVIRQYQEQAELNNCTFSPQINKSNKEQKGNRFEKLYQYGKTKIKEKRSISDSRELKELKNCTFAPKINKSSTKSHYQRDISSDFSNNKFSPSGKVSDLLKQLMFQREKPQKPIQKDSLTIEILKEYYQQFDLQGRGYISSATLDIKHLNFDVIQYFYPVLNIMHQENLELDEQQFINLALTEIPTIEDIARFQQNQQKQTTQKRQIKPNFKVKVKNQYQNQLENTIKQANITYKKFCKKLS